MIDYVEAAADVAAFLEDPRRSLIGDPRKGIYKVSLITNDMREAMQLARKLARLGIIPTTTIYHDQFGNPGFAHVNLYTVSDQEALLEAARPLLTEARAKALEDLVFARSPVPADLAERIMTARQRGMRPQTIADKLNELNVIAGMGGMRWTAQK